MSVYIDLTEFLKNPILTGIQRVTGEICRWWPTDDLRPVRLTEAGQLAEMPHSLIDAIARCFKSADGSAIRDVRTFSEQTIGTVQSDGCETILVPELFYDPQRVAFYRNMEDQTLQRCRFIVYDLLPLLHPEYFAPDMQHDIICGYFSLVRRIPQCGFISQSTQRAYCNRLLHSSALTGVVFPLGSDGLGAKPVVAVRDRPMHFCVVGTIEPRKNHALILDAFECLLRSMDGLRLTFLGRLGWVDAKFTERLRALSSGDCPGFEWISEASDDCIRRHVEAARASIYISAAEGFGLPPVESLWLGTPVIVSRGIPSMETIGSAGIHTVDRLTPESVREAVLAFQDNSYEEQKVAEAFNLDLPTWRSFTEEIAQWCQPQGYSKPAVVARKDVSVISSDQKPPKATSEYVQMVYEKLLGRELESLNVFEKNYRDMTVVEVLRAIISSAEFRQRFRVDATDQLFREGPFWNFTSTFDTISQIIANIAPVRVPMEGHIVNFLGVAMNVKFMDCISDRGGQLDPVPIPANYHADMAEWGSVLRSIELARQSYNIVELGCGWGCWINNTGVVCRRKGLRFAAVGVEGDAGHLEFARAALRTNGIREEACKLIHGVAGISRYALFPRQDRGGASWGLEPFFTNDPQECARRMQTGAYEDVPVISLKEALGEFNRVDLLHVDIQGGELSLLSNNVPLLNERVAYVFIGTHSRIIEGKLIDLLSHAGWELECERPAVVVIRDGVLSTVVDGVQAWRNPRL